MFDQLQAAIGFRHTVWIMCLVMLTTLLISIATLRIRLTGGPPRRLFEVQAWTERPFLLWTSYLFFCLLGLYLPSFYIQLYGMKYLGREQAFYLLPVANAGSFFGRIVSSQLKICYTTHSIDLT